MFENSLDTSYDYIVDSGWRAEGIGTDYLQYTHSVNTRPAQPSIMRVSFNCPICHRKSYNTICDRCASSIRRYITEKQFEEQLGE